MKSNTCTPSNITRSQRTFHISSRNRQNEMELCSAKLKLAWWTQHYNYPFAHLGF